MGLDIWLKKPWLRYLERIKSKIKVLVQFEVVYELNTLNTDKESCEFLKCLSLINVPHRSKCHHYAPSCADPTPRSHSGFPLLHLLHLTHQHISALRYHSGPSHHHLPLGQDKNLLTRPYCCLSLPTLFSISCQNNQKMEIGSGRPPSSKALPPS